MSARGGSAFRGEFRNFATMDFLKEFESKSSELIKYFKDQLAGIRGGRPTTKLVENIPVEYLGQKLRVLQLGSISIILPREIQILAWDRGAVSNVQKAVESSLKLKVNIEDNLIRINLPPLSEERRLELAKVVRKEAEEAKIKLRSFRDEILKKVKRQEEEGEITEDDKFKAKNRIEEITKKTNEEIDKILGNKIKEINE